MTGYVWLWLEGHRATKGKSAADKIYDKIEDKIQDKIQEWFQGSGHHQVEALGPYIYHVWKGRGQLRENPLRIKYTIR